MTAESAELVPAPEPLPEPRRGPKKAPRRFIKRPAVKRPSFAIGESDVNIFNCPKCSRPLATGVRAQRCPGCGTPLVLGTPAPRVVVFVAAGVMVGLLVMSLVSVVLGGFIGSRGDGPRSSAGTGSGNNGGVRPSPALAISPASRAAVSQLAALDARLVSASSSLRLALRAKDLDSASVADQLRSLAADAAYGDDLASRLGVWDEAYELSLDLSNVYGSIRSTAREGLAASIKNDPAYRAAAQKMIAVLNGVPPLDKRLRQLAAAADVRLPGNSPSAAPR